MLVLEHCSQKDSRAENSFSFSEIYSGTLEEIDNFISTLKIGDFTTGKGALSSFTRSQKGGNLWQVELEYEIEFDESGNSEDQGNGPQQSTLDGTMLSLPIEHNPNYKTNWNYYLIGLGENAKTIPSFWSTATDTFIDPTSEDFKKYRWIKSLSEIPTEKDYETNQYWQICQEVNENGEKGLTAKPKKPGVESYDRAVYTITETSRYSSKEKAGWAVSTALNTIVDSPPLGDFGINAFCNWKVDSANIYHDGKKWCSRVVYTLSGDSLGWDTELYDYTSSDEEE